MNAAVLPAPGARNTRDTRNDFFTPTYGTYQRLSAEVTLPGSTAEYFKLNYEFSKYWPLNRLMVLNTQRDALPARRLYARLGFTETGSLLRVMRWAGPY